MPTRGKAPADVPSNIHAQPSPARARPLFDETRSMTGRCLRLRRHTPVFCFCIVEDGVPAPETATLKPNCARIAAAASAAAQCSREKRRVRRSAALYFPDEVANGKQERQKVKMRSRQANRNERRSLGCSNAQQVEKRKERRSGELFQPAVGRRCAA